MDDLFKPPTPVTSTLLTTSQHLLRTDSQSELLVALVVFYTFDRDRYIQTLPNTIEGAELVEGWGTGQQQAAKIFKYVSDIHMVRATNI